jgi:methionyl-tRNA formyltransferase
MNKKPRFIYFGTTNQLSLSAFDRLLAGGAAPLAVVVTTHAAGSPADMPLQQLFPAASLSQLPLQNRYHRPTLIQAAWSAGVPLFALADVASVAIRDLITRLRTDFACFACFPWRLSQDLILSLPFGFLNVHPSLLPHYRGPAPLFWLFQRYDLAHRGITVHQMDAGLDTGPLVRQEPISFADGLDQARIEHQCGQIGGRLLLEAMRLLSSGRPARPQTDRGSYFPWPTPADYRLHSNWSALHAYNFMRATNSSRMAYPLTLAGQDLSLVEAVRVDPQGRQDAPLLLNGPMAQIQFQTGILTARLDLTPV